jgi:hypothetical protein
MGGNSDRQLGALRNMLVDGVHTLRSSARRYPKRRSFALPTVNSRAPVVLRAVGSVSQVSEYRRACQICGKFPLESVRSLYEAFLCLVIRRIMRRIMASWTKARCERVRFSKSLARRRQRPSHPNVRSTIQRLHDKPLRRVGAFDDFERDASRLPDGRRGCGTLIALDFLCRVVTHGVDRRPPFSAPFTLWLSTIVVVGLASLPASSRACTYRA